MENQNTFSALNELSKTNLGDKRLNDRLRKVAESFSRRPSDSFPEISNSVAELEATYRFLGNSKVTPEKILAPHIEATVSRACSKERIVIAHDTTEFTFGGKSRKEELGWTKQKNQGFFGHFAFCLSRTTFAQPLGVLGIETLFRKGSPREKKRGTTEIKTDPNRESLRWGSLAEKTENLFPAGVKPIHVMDREADDFELFSDLCRQNIRFVIRIRHDRRNCKISGKKDTAKLFDLLDEKNITYEREVLLGNRELGPAPKRYKPRAPRTAKLQISALRVEIPGPVSSINTPHEKLTLNCVHVTEVDTQKDLEPVDWKLITNEPITTKKEVLNIIDDYRSRWMIEEYFKALKTGCSYEKRQLESKESLLNALAVFVPIAWQLLLLRSLNQVEPNTPAKCALTKSQIEVLQAVSKKNLSESPTSQEALLAIAALGGHIPNNGAPGWIVLARGMETLLTMEIAWNAAKEIKQISQ
jgi:hypothetical protein